VCPSLLSCRLLPPRLLPSLLLTPRLLPSLLLPPLLLLWLLGPHVDEVPPISPPLSAASFFVVFETLAAVDWQLLLGFDQTDALFLVAPAFGNLAGVRKRQAGHSLLNLAVWLRIDILRSSALILWR